MKKIRRVVKVLSRRTKNIRADRRAGVGQDGNRRGLAQRIISGTTTPPC